jgi:imidazolonepropionase-like amidohydrolase
MLRRVWILSVLTAIGVPAVSVAAAMTALVGGTLIDGTGSAPVNNSVVLIDGNRIVAAGRRDAIAVPADAAVVSTVGLTVLPGLIDVAVHLDQLGHGNRARWREAYLPLTDKVVLPVASRALLAAGVTTARDVGVPLEGAKRLRQRIESARLPGPNLLLCGPHIGRTATGRDHELVAHTAVELRQAVQKLASEGADCVVLDDAAEYSAGELSTLHYSAEDAGLRWYAWVSHDADIAPSVRAGAFGLIGLGSDFHEALPAEAVAALTARAAGGRPVYWALGASVLNNHEWLRANTAPLDEPRWQAALPHIVAEDLRHSLANLSAQPIDLETPTLRFQAQGARVRAARSAGARFVVGSLAGEPGHIPSRATWQEVEALVVDAGYSPVDALRAATLDAAFILGRDAEIGSIAPGKVADVIAVRGDVLRSVDHLSDIRLVYHRGVRYTPSSSDEEDGP